MAGRTYDIPYLAESQSRPPPPNRVNCCARPLLLNEKIEWASVEFRVDVVLRDKQTYGHRVGWYERISMSSLPESLTYGFTWYVWDRATYYTAVVYTISSNTYSSNWIFWFKTCFSELEVQKRIFRGIVNLAISFQTARGNQLHRSEWQARTRNEICNRKRDKEGRINTF